MARIATTARSIPHGIGAGVRALEDSTRRSLKFGTPRCRYARVGHGSWATTTRRMPVKARLIRLGLAVSALVATAAALGAGRKWT
jgi:hypothetical protein